MCRTVSTAVLCTLTFSTMLWADEVRFKNGDRLSGQIVRVTEGKMVFKSAVAGEVTLNMADIQTFSSESPIEIHLKDGTVLHQPVTAAEPNQFAITAGEPLKPQTFFR